MRLVNDYADENDVLNADERAEAPPELAWPGEVDLILSAMEAGLRFNDRRISDRRPHRVRGELRYFADSPLDAPTPIFTRDLSPSGVGFIARDRLPLGYGGDLTLQLPDGTTTTITCTVYRCREAINGWYEGSLRFDVEQTIG